MRIIINCFCCANPAIDKTNETTPLLPKNNLGNQVTANTNNKLESVSQVAITTIPSPVVHVPTDRKETISDLAASRYKIVEKNISEGKLGAISYKGGNNGCYVSVTSNDPESLQSFDSRDSLGYSASSVSPELSFISFPGAENIRGF